jgi:hypothetical protein
VKFLTWLLGVMLLLLALEVTSTTGARWTAVWITAAIVWLFAGAGAALVSLAKLAAGKVGAGAPFRFKPPGSTAPAPHKEE